MKIIEIRIVLVALMFMLFIGFIYLFLQAVYGARTRTFEIVANGPSDFYQWNRSRGFCIYPPEYSKNIKAMTCPPRGAWRMDFDLSESGFAEFRADLKKLKWREKDFREIKRPEHITPFYDVVLVPSQKEHYVQTGYFLDLTNEAFPKVGIHIVYDKSSSRVFYRQSTFVRH